MKKVQELRQILSFETTLKEGYREGKLTCQTRSSMMLRNLQVGPLVSSQDYFSVICSGLKPYNLLPKLLMKNYNYQGNHRLANPASIILIRKR